MSWNLFIIPLTLIVVELLKRVLNNTRWLPHIAVAVGGLLGAIFALYYGVDWLEHIVSGLIYGASASGIYDVGASTIDKPPDISEPR